MDFILTLIAGARGGVLDDAIVDRARAALNAIGAETLAPDWLAARAACDIFFGGARPEQAEAAARLALDGLPVDLAAQPAFARRRRLLVADMDATIVDGETLDELAAFAGVKDSVAAITARAMNGEIDYKQSLRERIDLLKGLSADALEKTHARMRLNPGAETLVRTMRAHGAYTVLVSGGTRFFTDRVRDQVGFDLAVGNVYEVLDGRFTGRVAEPILDRDGKRQVLTEVAAKFAIPLSAVLAVGDGANDLPMLKTAGLGVAFHAKPAVAAEVRVRIQHADLTALLYLQGFRRETFSS
jgi:phosphoserine phosphatase